MQGTGPRCIGPSHTRGCSCECFTLPATAKACLSHNTQPNGLCLCAWHLAFVPGLASLHHSAFASAFSPLLLHFLPGFSFLHLRFSILSHASPLLCLDSHHLLLPILPHASPFLHPDSHSYTFSSPLFPTFLYFSTQILAPTPSPLCPTLASPSSPLRADCHFSTFASAPSSDNSFALKEGGKWMPPRGSWAGLGSAVGFQCWRAGLSACPAVPRTLEWK